MITTVLAFVYPIAVLFEENLHILKKIQDKKEKNILNTKHGGLRKKGESKMIYLSSTNI